MNVLSELVLNERLRLGMTQSELARKAFVALPTVVNLETGANKRRTRRQVIVRVAVALNKDPRDWLNLVGINNVTDEAVESLLSEGQNPKKIRRNFFDVMDQHVAQGPVLLCAEHEILKVFISQNGIRSVASLIRKGMSIAITVPYALNVAIETVPLNQMRLVIHGTEVWGNALVFINEIQNQIPVELRKQIAVLELSNPPILPPSTNGYWGSLTAPVLIKDNIKTGGCDGVFSYGQVRRIKCQTEIDCTMPYESGRNVCTGLNKTGIESMHNEMQMMKEFFSEIISLWNGNEFMPGDLSPWKRVFIGPIALGY